MNPVSLARVLASLSEEEARAAYDALAQWADNERAGIEEYDEPMPGHEQRVAAVEGIVGRLETELVRLAESAVSC